MQDAKQHRYIAATVLPYALGLVLLGILMTEVFYSIQPTMLRRVAVGMKDEIDYSHSATKADAERLGRALQGSGFLVGLGSFVRLSKGTSGTVVSFVTDENEGDDPEVAFVFEELGRSVADSIGGLPIKVRLMDSRWAMRKELSVGKVTIGARDEIYYFGSATAMEAETLGQMLRSARYLVDTGTQLVLSRNGSTAISFVVADGAWDNPVQVRRFERLASVAATSVGGLPIILRLLNSKMQKRKEITIHARFQLAW